MMPKVASITQVRNSNQNSIRNLIPDLIKLDAELDVECGLKLNSNLYP